MRDFHRPGRSAVFAENGMCATSHPLAAAAAIDMLKSGGNAMEAAITGAVLLGFCEPQMTGIGGDMFALVSNETSPDAILAYNGSGRAPAGLDPSILRTQGQEIDPKSANAVTLPGALHGLENLHKNHGSGKSFAECLAPAIHYAEAGIPVAPRVAFDWAQAAGNLQGTARDLFLKNGQPPKPRDIFRAPGQAEVLRNIAKHGVKAFYEGSVAEDMVTTLQAHGGTHTLEDFANTKSSVGRAISGSYRDRTILEHPPNGQGMTALLLAAMLEHLGIASLDPFGAQRVHLEAEATKLAYAIRNRDIADPDHMVTGSMPDENAIKAQAEQLVAQIDPKRAGAFAPSLGGAPHKDTVYITVVDRDRRCVSLIYSIFHSFGSGIASDKFGILLHNRGAGFTLEEGHPNEAGPGKRPFHTIIPGMLAKGDTIEMPFGVMGGQYQAVGHARLVSNILDFGMDPQSAIDAPRSFAIDGSLQLEHGYSDKIAADLEAMGHKVTRPETPIGGAQAIKIHASGVLEGASDPRKDGIALGY